MNVDAKEETRNKAIRDAVRNSSKVPGRKLGSNDGIILQQALIKENEWANEYIVLALVEGNFQPFVTWKRTVGVQQLADGKYGPIEYCWSGEYHRDLMKALMDFESRVTGAGGALDEREPSSRQG